MFGNYILVVVAIMIAFGLPTRANSDCYPAAGIEVFERTTVRERYWVRAATDRKAEVGERFAVESSKVFDFICWVGVEGGWIISKSVIPGMPPDPEPEMPEAELPRIEGDASFRLKIRDGLDYLWHEAREWFWYVVNNIESISPAPESQHWSSADSEKKHIMFSDDHIRLMIARVSVLVHEACHMVQGDRGDFVTPFDPDEKVIRLERECYTIQREAVWDIDPDSWYADFYLTRILSWTVDKWKAVMIR